MGKKKSVVLMVIISIVLAALTLFTVLPSFSFPWNNGLHGWNSVVEKFVDFGSDYKGGHYAYYYPEGVISESQYKTLAEDEKGDYTRLETSGLYLDKDAEFVANNDGDGVSSEFAAEMAKFRDVVAARYSAKGYSDYTVTVVDGYAIRVELPVTDVNYATTFSSFAETSEITLKVDGETVEELAEEGASLKNYIKAFSVRSQFAYRYIHVRLTAAGKDLINGLEENSKIVSQSADTTQDGTKGLWIYFGETPALPIYTENVASDFVLKCAYNEAKNQDVLETNVILMNSLLNDGSFSFKISDVSSEIREKSHAYGVESDGIMLIVLAVLTVAAIAVAIVLNKKFGVVFGYMAFTYVCFTGLCFAFIAASVFEFSLGTAFAYVLGLGVMFMIHSKQYNAIKNEVSLGKTVNSAVTLGYKKTLLTTVDVYVVLAIGALAFALGIAGSVAFGFQMLICVVAGAFNSLLWGRVINCLLLSASKDKYKYFGLVREEDDDE